VSDLSDTILAKSDQLVADDLLSGPRTIRIAGVDADPAAEQPVTIHIDGDDAKPWRPSKSMRRVLVHAWGPDGAAYVGRSVTLYRDPAVTWGGAAVGGIRIAAMSHIERPITLALAESRKSRKPFTVQPLAVQPAEDKAARLADDLVARFDEVANAAELFAVVDDVTVRKQRAWLAEKRPELARDVDAAALAAKARTEAGE
jgi:hypothetical protein